MPNATIVAFYQQRPHPLADVVTRIRATAADALPSFIPRPLDEVHATIISLSSPTHPHRYPDAAAADLRSYLRRTFDDGPLDVRFGGFAASDQRFTSRGEPPYRRSVGAVGGRVVVLGWPDPGRDVHRLAHVRSACEAFGFVHDYHRDGGAPDIDMYAVVGGYDPEEPADAFLDQAREALSRSATRTRVDAGMLRFVTYEDTRLPSATSRAEAL